MADSKIPMLDLQAEVAELWGELSPELERVLRSARFIMGPEVEAFEQELAAYLGVEHAIAVNSGTDALVIALQALGIGPGDEVITTPFTFIASGSCILRVGAKPVFCDIDTATLNLDPARVTEALTPRTKAILPVHIFGHACAMDDLTEIASQNRLLIVEDVAQALSGRYGGKHLGTFGDASAFSFFPSKNLGAYGDAGLVTARDPSVAERARMLRAHGARRKYHNEILGFNSRMDAIQATILRVKLRHLEQWTADRRRIADRYSTLLAPVPGIVTPTEATTVHHCYHQYTVRVSAKRRVAIRECLSRAGVSSMVYYPVPLTQLPVFAEHAVKLPIAEGAASEVLSLPIWPGMPEGPLVRVVEALADAMRGLSDDR